MKIFHGSNALSQSENNKLISLIKEILPEVNVLIGKYIHFIELDNELNDGQEKVLKQLLNYGRSEQYQEINSEEALSLIVTPRPGTISPWSSKATDIAHHCGLKASIKRIERGILYQIITTEKSITINITDVNESVGYKVPTSIDVIETKD